MCDLAVPGWQLNEQGQSKGIQQAGGEHGEGSDLKDQSGQGGI